MKAFVDENVCISCGLCEGVCSDVFSLDTGVAVATEEVSAENEDLVSLRWMSSRSYFNRRIIYN